MRRRSELVVRTRFTLLGFPQVQRRLEHIEFTVAAVLNLINVNGSKGFGPIECLAAAVDALGTSEKVALLLRLVSCCLTATLFKHLRCLHYSVLFSYTN